MLTYTFSTREKVLLAALAFVAILIAWYNLIFVNLQNRIAEIDGKIAAAQDELVLNQSQATSIDTMNKTVQQYQEMGLAPVLMPNYDNTQSLMAFLNGVLAGKPGFSISFEDPELGEDGTVHRVGTINYGAGSYEEARQVVENISRGPYPCRIDALGITDSSRSRSGTSQGGSFTNSIQVTFFEKPTGDFSKNSSSSSEVKGQDLSKMKDWNK